MSDELDWLSDLVPKKDEEATPTEGAPEPIDLLVGLRDEISMPETMQSDAVEKPRVQRFIGGMVPWQVFFLSVLMFLDIAIVGMLFLVMLGRVVIP